MTIPNSQLPPHLQNQPESVFLTSTKMNYFSGKKKENQEWDKEFSKLNPYGDYHSKMNYKVIIGTPRKTNKLLAQLNFKSPRTEKAIRRLELHIDVLFPEYSHQHLPLFTFQSLTEHLDNIDDNEYKSRVLIERIDIFYRNLMQLAKERTKIIKEEVQVKVKEKKLGIKKKKDKSLLDQLENKYKTLDKQGFIPIRLQTLEQQQLRGEMAKMDPIKKLNRFFPELQKRNQLFLALKNALLLKNKNEQNKYINAEKRKKNRKKRKEKREQTKKVQDKLRFKIEDMLKHRNKQITTFSTKCQKHINKNDQQDKAVEQMEKDSHWKVNKSKKKLKVELNQRIAHQNERQIQQKFEKEQLYRENQIYIEAKQQKLQQVQKNRKKLQNKKVRKLQRYHQKIYQQTIPLQQQQLNRTVGIIKNIAAKIGKIDTVIKQNKKKILKKDNRRKQRWKILHYEKQNELEEEMSDRKRAFNKLSKSVSYKKRARKVRRQIIQYDQQYQEQKQQMTHMTRVKQLEEKFKLERAREITHFKSIKKQEEVDQAIEKQQYKDNQFQRYKQFKVHNNQQVVKYQKSNKKFNYMFKKTMDYIQKPEFSIKQLKRNIKKLNFRNDSEIQELLKIETADSIGKGGYGNYDFF